MAETVAGFRPTELVRAAVDALEAQFFEPVDVAQLLADAWDGAGAALTADGLPDVPLPPAFPRERARAIAMHDQAFPALEALAESTIGQQVLAIAALRELALRRRDGHTALQDPTTTSFLMPMLTGTRNLEFGLILSATPPLRIAAVAPGSPAQRAGLHHGLAVVTINGRPATARPRMDALRLLHWDAEETSLLVVQEPDGRIREVPLTPAPTSLLRQAVVADHVGFLRFDCFPMGAAAAALATHVQAALEAFEQHGVRRWVVDLRWNVGGWGATVTDITRLFAPRGRLWRVQRRVVVPGPDGIPLPLMEEVEAGSGALAVQRPLALLVGPGSQSGAELFAGALQALGRATLVGERTTGALSAGAPVTLAPGWSFFVTIAENLVGPELQRLNRIGLTPDVPVAPSVEDEAAGRDPQLERAVHVLASTD